MPKPSQSFTDHVDKLERDKHSLIKQLSDYTVEHGKVEDLQNEYKALSKAVEELKAAVGTLEEQKAKLEEWTRDYASNKRSEIESQLRQVRNELQTEINELRATKAVEQESIRELLNLQEINTKKTQREAAMIARQLGYLEEQRNFCRGEVERLNSQAKAQAATRGALNERVKKLDERETKLDRREREVNVIAESSSGEVKRAETILAAAKKQNEKASEAAELIQRERNALNQERQAVKNEIIQFKVDLERLKDEYEAARANLTAIERRERLVEAKERALKRKGIVLELD